MSVRAPEMRLRAGVGHTALSGRHTVSWEVRPVLTILPKLKRDYYRQVYVMTYQLSDVGALEAEAIHIIREVAAEFERPALLFSGGKDSILLLCCILILEYEHDDVQFDAQIQLQEKNL